MSVYDENDKKNNKKENTELRGSVCKSGPVHSGSKNSLPLNFAQ